MGYEVPLNTDRRTIATEMNWCAALPTRSTLVERSNWHALARSYHCSTWSPSSLELGKNWLRRAQQLPTHHAHAGQIVLCMVD